MPDNFPAELITMILAFLTDQDWRVQALVCTQWNKIVKELRIRSNYDRERQRQLAVLGDSELYQYLLNIANKGDTSDYFNKLLLPCLGSNQQSVVSTLDNFIFYFWNIVPEYWDEKYSTFSCELKRMETPFAEQAAQLILNVEKYNPSDNANPHTSLKNFLSFRLEHRGKQNETFLAYQALENKLLAMVTLVQLAHGVNNPEKHQNPFKVICDPKINRWIQGHDLVLLDRMYVFELIEIMIRETVKWYQLSNDQMGQYPNLEAVQAEIAMATNLLSRMKANDWLAYLTLSIEGFIHSTRLDALMKAVRCNHPVILAELNEMVLLKIVRSRFGHHCSTLILQSSIALGHLSDSSVKKIAKISALGLGGRQVLPDPTADRLDDYSAPEFSDSDVDSQIESDADESIKLEEAEGDPSSSEQEDDPGSDSDTDHSHQPGQNDKVIPPTKIIMPVPPKPDNGLIKPNSHWKLGLKIGGLILLGLIGVGIIAATGGIGAVVGIPILIQTLLFAVGGTCILSAAGGLIYNFFTRKNTATYITATCEHSKSSLLSSPATMRRTLSTNSLSVVNSKIIPYEDTYTSDTLSINPVSKSISKQNRKVVTSIPYHIPSSRI